MTQAELLRYLAEVLDTLGVEYMIGGSQASMYYGEPRLTRDVYVIVDLDLEHLQAFLGRFSGEEFCVDEDTAQEAIRTSGQFNVIHPGSGSKIDVYLNPDTPYDRIRLARRQKLPLTAGVEAYFARPEDVIPHLRDILGILRISGPELDEAYIAEWVERLGLQTIWTQIRRQAE